MHVSMPRELKSSPSSSLTHPGHGAKVAAHHIVASSDFHQKCRTDLDETRMGQRSAMLITHRHSRARRPKRALWMRPCAQAASCSLPVP
jgi:hypothetical protein